MLPSFPIFRPPPSPHSRRAALCLVRRDAVAPKQARAAPGLACEGAVNLLAASRDGIHGSSREKRTEPIAMRATTPSACPNRLSLGRCFSADWPIAGPPSLGQTDLFAGCPCSRSLPRTPFVLPPPPVEPAACRNTGRETTRRPSFVRTTAAASCRAQRQVADDDDDA